MKMFLRIMHIRQLLLALAFATGLFAGGPDIECDTIHIDNVEIMGLARIFG